MERRGKVQKGGCWFCCHRRQTTVSVKSNQQEVGEVIWSKQKVYRKSIGGQNEEVSKTSLEFLCSCTLASRSDIWPGSHKMCKDTQNVSSWCVIQNFRPKWAKKIVFQCFARKKACLYKFATKIQHERCEASLFFIPLPNEHLSRIQRKTYFKTSGLGDFNPNSVGRDQRKGKRRDRLAWMLPKKIACFFIFLNVVRVRHVALPAGCHLDTPTPLVGDQRQGQQSEKSYFYTQVSVCKNTNRSPDISG